MPANKVAAQQNNAAPEHTKQRFVATNAASSGVKLERKTIKALGKRSDKPGLIWLAQWAGLLLLTGTLLHWSLGTWWVIPAMIAYSIVLIVPAYSISHETAHGTAFRTRWLNEVVMFISCVIYFEEAYHRRYAHTSHHTYTYHIGKDGQIPYALPMTFKEWLLEFTNAGYYGYYIKLFVNHALGRFSPEVREYTPESELPKQKWGARACLAVYAALAVVVAFGYLWPLIFLVIPRLVGGPAMTYFTILQHADMQENSPSIIESTRSFTTNNWLAKFLYMNMNNHVEHHLYPQIPFYSLLGLGEALKDQLPEPDPGLWRTNREILSVVIRRSLGKNTKAATIRQAPHMITEGGFTPITQSNMR